ncbi:hypothetical protein [Nonlabens agnitus]|uniref:CopG family transcriptional regulator n=1 Tax=Nonlabens agnitus TaxID=870484 RepID=A0A2S9WRZ8_9FLAO|nr:hypothetical protein [Nonlabens agnitus]PRP66274.1 hypothetical protein BST86_03790 [Nonlabens agnitus]
MDKNEMSEWMDMIKKEKPPTVQQKVVPIKSSQLKRNKYGEEVQLSCYMDKGLMKRLKLQALKEDETIKNIINKSITLYLKSND